MKVKITSSKIVKPALAGGGGAAESVPLSVFDRVTYDVHVAVIYAFRPPNPPNAALEQGLARALGVYREWAGRLVDGPDGRPAAVVLNDAGARLVEAAVDAPLARSMPLKPSPELLRLHPSIDGGRGRRVEELVQVQLTRFACGSLVVGFTAHHRVADGHAAGNFLVAWGLATRRLPLDPLPVCDRATRFRPRAPPLVEFPHRDTEYYVPVVPAAKNRGEAGDDDDDDGGGIGGGVVAHDKIKVHKVLFTKDFVARLKARASSGHPPPHHHHRRGQHYYYSTFESVVGHLWRAVTAARGLGAGETTRLRVSVDGRARMRPPVPRGYLGNVVLWAFPVCDAGELVSRPAPQHAAELIRAAVARVDDAYFRSFVDFASSGAVEAEGLAPTADESREVMCPDMEVDSWLGISFYDLDFGGGGPFHFMPSYLPMEGAMFLLPSFLGDGGVEAYVSLFEGHLEEFKRICYNIDAPALMW